MVFDDEHAKWLSGHMRRRTGERKSRLERGHGHGERLFLERVWWPIFGNLHDLHPEYEVSDWRGRPYFVDLAWMPGRIKFAFEIKGFGPHVQNTDRIRYRRELNRETYLSILGYRVVSIPYDDLEEQPELTISLLKSLLSPYATVNLLEDDFTRLEREVMRVAFRTNKPVRPVDLVNEFEIHKRTAIRILQSLCIKGKCLPILSGKSTRVSRYEFVRSLTDDYFI